MGGEIRKSRQPMEETMLSTRKHKKQAEGTEFQGKDGLKTGGSWKDGSNQTRTEWYGQAGAGRRWKWKERG